MASRTQEPGGGWRIQFKDRNGKRSGIRVGKMSKSDAGTITAMVGRLVSSSKRGERPDDLAAAWVMSLGEELHEKLAAVGLVEARQSSELGQFLAKYIANRPDLKPKSLAALDDTRKRLSAFLGERKALRSLTVQDADAWRADLVKAGLSLASQRRYAGDAKAFFNKAVEWRMIESNPFCGLPSGPTATKNTRYITPEETEAIMGMLPAPKWRALWALARYGGLRVSSETSGLTWADVDFEKRRLRVRCEKTEGHEGREDRELPIRPELLRRLQEAFDVEKAVPIGEARICGHTGGWIDEVLKKAIEAAGVKPWADLWKKARSSSEVQMELEGHRSEAVAGWHGHSEKIAKKHYRTGILDSEFDAVASGGGRPVQNPVQGVHVSGCTDAHRDVGAKKCDSVSGAGAGTCGSVREDASELQIAATGVEPVT